MNLPVYAKHKDHVYQSGEIVSINTTTLIFLSKECCNCKITLIKKEFKRKEGNQRKGDRGEDTSTIQLTLHDEKR